MNNNEKETVFDILNNVGLQDMKHTKGLISARMKDAWYNVQKTLTEFLNPRLPAIEKIEET